MCLIQKSLFYMSVKRKCNFTFVYARLHYVYFLIHQDRKFMLQQSFLPSVHSGSQKQMFIIIFERLGLRAASSLNVFSCAKWARKTERNGEEEYPRKVTQMQQKVHLWRNMSSALFCNFVVSPMLIWYVHNLQNCVARDAIHFVLQWQKGGLKGTFKLIIGSIRVPVIKAQEGSKLHTLCCAAPHLTKTFQQIGKEDEILGTKKDGNVVRQEGGDFGNQFSELYQCFE